MFLVRILCEGLVHLKSLLSDGCTSFLVFMSTGFLSMATGLLNFEHYARECEF